jgi:hypothetical protein
MIEQILSELRKFRSSDFFFDADIAPAKLRNAIEHYPIRGGETVMALVDATVFGSAKNGMAFGHSGIYWKNDWTTDTAKTFLGWDEVMQCVDTMAVKGTNFLISPGCVLNLAGSQVKPQALITLFSNIKRNVLTCLPKTDTDAAPALEPGTARQPTVGQAQPTPADVVTGPVHHAAPQKAFEGSYDPRRLALVQAIARRHRLPKSVHIAPAIQVAKVRTILDACGRGINPYSILAVVDNTFLQTGKDFLIVTDKALIAKGMLRKVDQFALSDIREIRSNESTFYVNNHDFQCFDQLSDSELMVLCDFLRELVPALQRTDGPNEKMTSVVAESFDKVKTRVHHELNDDSDPEFGEVLEQIVQVLFEIFHLIVKHSDPGNTCSEDDRPHQFILAFALLASYAFHHAEESEAKELLGGVYFAAGLAAIETVVFTTRAKGLYLRRSDYSDLFQGMFAAQESGLAFDQILKSLFDEGAPEDRKTAMLAQQAAADSLALLNRNF